MKSIWIGIHAIKQYAARVEQRDPETLTADDKLTIKGKLLEFYQHSKQLDEQALRKVGYRGRAKPGNLYYVCAFRQDKKRVVLVLICGSDDAHHSGAIKLVTVVKVQHRNADSL